MLFYSWELKQDFPIHCWISMLRESMWRVKIFLKVSDKKILKNCKPFESQPKPRPKKPTVITIGRTRSPDGKYEIEIMYSDLRYESTVTDKSYWAGVGIPPWDNTDSVAPSACKRSGYVSKSSYNQNTKLMIIFESENKDWIDRTSILIQSKK